MGSLWKQGLHGAREHSSRQMGFWFLGKHIRECFQFFFNGKNGNLGCRLKTFCMTNYGVWGVYVKWYKRLGTRRGSRRMWRGYTADSQNCPQSWSILHLHWLVWWPLATCGSWALEKWPRWTLTTCGFWVLEMWLRWLRNWIFNFNHLNLITCS